MEQGDRKDVLSSIRHGAVGSDILKRDDVDTNIDNIKGILG
jgi:hypothetical protein